MSAFLSSRIVRYFILIALACIACCGCGTNEEKFWPVSGQVSLDGKPLKVGTVSFRPDPTRGNTSLHHPTAEIDPQGRFSLVTVNRTGAPLGWYKVLVFADENAQPGVAAHPVMPRWLVPVQYTDERTTPLSVEVVAAPSSGAYDLKLKK